jgi:NAD(P)-dependent dehydrogenase (short-subunit alcohol dehydrogenase family)
LCPAHVIFQVVANAGVGGTFDIAGASLEDWKQVNSVNYDGVFYLARVVGTYVSEHYSRDHALTVMG